MMSKESNILIVFSVTAHCMHSEQTVAVTLFTQKKVSKIAVTVIYHTLTSTMIWFWKSWERSLNNSKQQNFNVLKGKRNVNFDWIDFCCSCLPNR
jgi:hypothetical protein